MAANNRPAWSRHTRDETRRVNGAVLAVVAAAVVSMGAAGYAGYRIARDERPPAEAVLPVPAPSRVEPGGYPSAPVYVAPSPSASRTPAPAPSSSPPPARARAAKTKPTARPSSRAARTTPAWRQRVIESTSVLTTGQSWSTDRLRLTVTDRGNLVLRDQGRTVFQTGTTTGVKLVMQNDGHLVLYDARDGTAWSSGTAGNPGAVLILRADGNMVIAEGDRVLFQTGTAD